MVSNIAIIGFLNDIKCFRQNVGAIPCGCPTCGDPTYGCPTPWDHHIIEVPKV